MQFLTGLFSSLPLNWIEKAHNNLNINNNVDRRMLTSMSIYIERVTKYVIQNPFLVNDSGEKKRQALDMPTNNQILPPKRKSSRDESVSAMRLTLQQCEVQAMNIIFLNNNAYMFFNNIGNCTAIHVTPTAAPSRAPPLSHTYRRAAGNYAILAAKANATSSA